ncbi:hypothetical protein Tco_1115772 [Tanacetum coccineum]
MDTIVCHEEPRSQTSSLYTIPVMATPEVTSIFTITIPPPHPFFNPLPQQATPTLTPTTFEATTSFPSLPDVSFVFKFNDKITNLEKDLSKIKQVDPYAQALSFIPAIVDRYIDNKLREAIQKAILAHNLDCREEAQAEKRDYIELADTSMRAILKEKVNTQLPQILPQDVSDFATLVIEKTFTKSLEDAVLARSSSQPKSNYEAAASLSEEIYDALVKSYQTNKYLFDTYGEVFILKRSRDDKDKDQDPSAGSDRGTKRRKSSKEAESSRDSSLPMQRSQVTQLMTRECNKIKSSTRTCISQVARAKEPRTLFDELLDTSFDFSAFVLNRLNIKDLTQEILATTERLDWHNPEGKPYPFDLSKPLSLIRDHRGRQVIPQDFFINNDLEYLKGGDLSRRYSTSITKTKAAAYEIKWIKDFVQNLWSPLTVKYDKHAYKGTSYLGPKRQHFYGFAANMSSLKDVYSRKRIIAVTRLTIIKKYDYGHLEEIEVRRDD